MRRYFCSAFIFLCCAWGATAWGTTLPIKASANNRYLVDQNNVPFLFVSDAAHHIVCALAQANWNTYFADRQLKGYTVIDIFSTFTTGNCPSSGAAVDGQLPFTTGNGPSSYDLSTPNPTFWSEIDTLLNDAANHNLVVLFNPLITQDFLVTMQNNGTTKCFNFGAYIGNRYKSFKNIIWYSGNDFQTWHTQSDLNLVAQIMAGIASADTNHLQSLQLDYFRSYSNQATATVSATVTLDAVYTYYETYDYISQTYSSSPTLPVFLIESNYEGGNNTHQLPGPATPKVVRQEAYWAMTSGAAGYSWGNESVNHFDTSYPGSLNSPGAAQVQYGPQLFNKYAWWNLVPDTAHAVVTAGFGTANTNNENLTTATYATTAWVTDGSLAMTYSPTTATLTANMAKFSKAVSASWYDPTNGTYHPIVGSPFANSGTQNFATPGTNSEGSSDWILVLSTALTAPAPPTNLKATVQ
jgi:hypothetical protein